MPLEGVVGSSFVFDTAERYARIPYCTQTILQQIFSRPLIPVQCRRSSCPRRAKLPYASGLHAPHSRVLILVQLNIASRVD